MGVIYYIFFIAIESRVEKEMNDKRITCDDARPPFSQHSMINISVVFFCFFNVLLFITYRTRTVLYVYSYEHAANNHSTVSSIITHLF